MKVKEIVLPALAGLLLGIAIGLIAGCGDEAPLAPSSPRDVGVTVNVDVGIPKQPDSTVPASDAGTIVTADSACTVDASENDSGNVIEIPCKHVCKDQLEVCASDCEDRACIKRCRVARKFCVKECRKDKHDEKD